MSNNLKHVQHIFLRGQKFCRGYSPSCPLPKLRTFILWSGRSGDVTMILQAAIEITCHDHYTTAWVGRCYMLLRYLVFVFVVRFLFISWFPCIWHSIIFWGFPHVMVRVPLQIYLLTDFHLRTRIDFLSVGLFVVLMHVEKVIMFFFSKPTSIRHNLNF